MKITKLVGVMAISALVSVGCKSGDSGGGDASGGGKEPAVKDESCGKEHNGGATDDGAGKQ
ncbi:MAG: hypothetical protein KIT58_22650 [Planctomycetota bacterium]|nr:hypothetical protein [Planctomycetota bacterium]